MSDEELHWRKSFYCLLFKCSRWTRSGFLSNYLTGLTHRNFGSSLLPNACLLPGNAGFLLSDMAWWNVEVEWYRFESQQLFYSVFRDHLGVCIFWFGCCCGVSFGLVSWVWVGVFFYLAIWFFLKELYVLYICCNVIIRKWK